MIDKIVRGLITLALVGTTIYMWISEGATPPAELLAITTLSIGQYIPSPGSFTLKKAA